MAAHPTAFISYSWDDEAHKGWVRELATRLRHDGVDVHLDHWHAVPGDQLPHFMEREIRENNFVIIVCTPTYKAKSDKRTGGVGYEGDIMTAEVLTKQNHRKFIPVLVRGSWEESAPSWLRGKSYVDLSGDSKNTENYQELLNTIAGTRLGAPPLGPPPAGYKPPSHVQPPGRLRAEPQHVSLELFDRRLLIHDEAMRLIAHVIAKGTCTQEELDQFLRNTKDARFLFNEDVESYLRTLGNEALSVRVGQQKQEGLAYAPKSEEFQKSIAAWRDRLIWFTEQLDEVKKRFDPFLQIQE